MNYEQAKKIADEAYLYGEPDDYYSAKAMANEIEEAQKIVDKYEK